MNKELKKEGFEDLLSPLRPKRKAAKVDYSEKKEDFYFDQKNNAEAQASLVKEPQCIMKKRKPNINGNGNADSNTNFNVKVSANGNVNGNVNANANANSNSNANAVANAIVNADGSQKARSESPVLEDDASSIPWNYQPNVRNANFSNLLNLEGAVVKNKIELVLKDKFSVKKDETIYLICEPPGEPYYIGRIMGFVKKNAKNEEEGQEKSDKLTKRNSNQLVEPAEEYMFKINWWYRCRDISKSSNDSRLLYASMHSDKCPLQSFRGKCIVKHKDEIEDFEQYKSISNHFWFERFFDRYMIKFYDVLPTSLLSGLPSNYHKALQKRFPYIFVEQGKSRDMLESPKSCIKCNQWSSLSDSIECCECGDFYHMLCLDPPLLKKPARGFAWSCIKCTKHLENTKLIPNEKIKNSVATNQYDNEVNEPNFQQQLPTKSLPSYEEAAIVFLEKDKVLSFEERRNLEEWNYRYLGMHAKLEDALDVQDHPYPRAASRLGTKHQFTSCPDWFDHKVVYYDSSELPEEFQKAQPVRGKKKSDGRRKRQTQSEEAEEIIQPLKLPQEFKDTDPDEFPGWLQERPKGYIERGGNDTAELQWKMPEDEKKANIDEYIKNCDHFAEQIDLLPTTPNFQDAILKNLLSTNYDIEKAMGLNAKITKATLKEPELTPAEVKRFEEGVKKYGSKLWPVTKEIKTVKHSTVVRYYYLWKKTPNGRLIWGNYEGRRKNRSQKQDDDEDDDEGEDDNEDDIANEADDSSYDVEKSLTRELCCKHCKTRESRQWYRSPSGQLHPNDNLKVINALCQRCARLWRRYAVVWEEPIEVMKKIGQKGGNGWKKKVEYELMVDAELIVKARSESPAESTVVKKKQKQASIEPTSAIEEVKEKEKKSLKKKEIKNVERKEPKKKEEKPTIVVSNVLNTNGNLHQAIFERYHHSTSPHHNSKLKFKDISFQKSPLVSHSSANSIAANSKLQKILPVYHNCSVCITPADLSNSLICLDCGARAHPACYGVGHKNVKSDLGSYKWLCDPCSNALNPLVSEDYACVICHYEAETKEPLMAGLKRTNEGQWVHVLCALFASTVKFDDLSSLQPIVNISTYVTNCLRYNQCDISSLKCFACSTKVDYKKLLIGDVFQVGFKFREDFKPDSKSIKITNSFGKIYPVVSCLGHGDTQILALCTEAKRFKQSDISTLFQIYLEDYKKSTTISSATQSRYEEFMNSVKILSNVEPGNEKLGGIIKNQCSKCLTRKTLKWVKNEYGIICYTCHLIELEEGVSKELPNDENIEMQDDNTNAGEKELPFSKHFSEVVNSALDGSKYGFTYYTERLVKPVELSDSYKLTPAVFQRLKDGCKEIEHKIWESTDPMTLRNCTELESVANTALQRFGKNISTTSGTTPKEKMSIGNILG